MVKIRPNALYLTKREIREKWRVAIVTKMKPDMSIIAPFENTRCVTCPQGQPLQWLEYSEEEDRHFFVVRAADPPALKAALDRLLDDERLRERLGAAARDAVGDYTYDAMLEAFDRALAAAGALSGRV